MVVRCMGHNRMSFRVAVVLRSCYGALNYVVVPALRMDMPRPRVEHHGYHCELSYPRGRLSLCERGQTICRSGRVLRHPGTRRPV